MNWTEIAKGLGGALPGILKLEFLKGVRSEVGLALMLAGLVMTLLGVDGGMAVTLAGVPVSTWGIIERVRRNKETIDAWQARINAAIDQAQAAADAAPDKRPE